MFIFLWKISRYSSCIRSLESVLKPVLRVHLLGKTMSFSSGTRPPILDDVYSYDYMHKTQGGSDYGHDVAPRCPEQRELPKYLLERPLKHRKPPLNVNCGGLRMADHSLVVHMTGRVQFQRINRFISLRDSHGFTQLVVLEERLDLMKRIRNIPIDSHIEIIGIVQMRPKHTINTSMATGAIEVVITEILDVFIPKRKHHELGGEEATGQAVKKARSSILMTSGELNRCGTLAARKKFQQRTHNCGELNQEHSGLTVTLCGWIESLRYDRFVIIRDGYGGAQLLVNRTDGHLIRILQKADINTLITVKGTVSMRPLHLRNDRMPTGDIEIKVSSLEIIDPNEPESDAPKSEQENSNVELDAQSSGPPPGDVNSYCDRTHTCGELRGADSEKEVVLCGWLSSKRTTRFGVIRDGHGSTQLLVPTDLEATVGKVLGQTSLESVIMVSGTVCARPPDQIIATLPTGEIEVVLKEFTVLNPAKQNLPFIIRDHNRANENLRMRHRYLDLRFNDMQTRLRLRSKVLMKMREFLINERGFVEVETPTLFRRTPGGAQEYLVPTRTEGKFYSLVQSPQQLKQLLMIGSMDRYFQVARCYRDEGARPDRQPEFTQMDIELSFTNRDMIMKLIEDLLRASISEVFTLQSSFPVIKYHEAMHWYGSDKPDISFDKKLIDISELVKDKSLLPDDLSDVKDFTAKVLFFDHIYPFQKLKLAIRDCEETQKMKGDNKAKLLLVKCLESTWVQDIEEALPFVDAHKLKNAVEFPIPSTIVIGVGQESQILPLMGKLRIDTYKPLTSSFQFAWIVDFPLFMEGDDGTLESSHHPFTQANQEDVHLLDSTPLKVRGLHFDLVLNGCEVGGGSVRIHDPVMQTKVLKDILKIPTESLQHLLEALACGAPPHGGIALGIDRLLSILVHAETIRDVIAFPKGVDGKDPMSGAPCSISDEEKKLYHLMPRSPK